MRRFYVMPSFVIVEKCDGCKALDKTACQYICPNDLMVLEPVQKLAYNQEPDQCWECYNCVKICPQQAIEVRHYADIMPLGLSLIHISEPTRLGMISYAVFCLKKK